MILFYFSVEFGPVWAVFKAARLARDGLKKSQTLIVFVRVGHSFKKSGRFAASYPARRPTLFYFTIDKFTKSVSRSSILSIFQREIVHNDDY
jgi:hypothetical protein